MSFAQKRKGEKMDDRISRQAAIDALADMHCKSDEDGYVWIIRSDAWARIDALASAQPERCEDCENFSKTRLLIPPPEQWIPCSERLPEIGEHYVSEPCIVYCSNGAYGFAELEENIFGQVGWNCERDDEYHEPLGEVLAWMPLPSPYKGEQE